MKRHPARYELFAYAESLVGQGAPVSARTAGHVVRCRACMEEVGAMRASLEFVAQAPEINPSEELAATILMSAQVARRAAMARRQRWETLVTAVKGLACAAGVVVVAAVYFSMALTAGAGEVSVAYPAALTMSMARTAPAGDDAMSRIAEEVRTLASAVNTPSKTPPSIWEREHRRTVVALERDIAAALAALERNPGCTRAANLVTANLQRQADALRTLYIERSL